MTDPVSAILEIIARHEKQATWHLDQIDKLDIVLAALAQVEIETRVEQPPDKPRETTLVVKARHLHDPLQVIARPGAHKPRPRGRTRTRPGTWYDLNVPPPDPNESETVVQRAELVVEMLGQGRMSQDEIAAGLEGLLGCDEGAARGVASRSLWYLAGLKRVRWTGEKVPTRYNERRVSPVVELVEGKQSA